ncbi:hypothetical protein DITRI_Ditri08aG0012200 [Diplodiscus trichospermus]
MINPSILIWNYQGAASQEFKRACKTLVHNYRPDVLALLEPRISGLKADSFIKKSGFEYSYRMKAVGFSERIWILWNGRINVTIEHSHTQFIHFRVDEGGQSISYVTVVYGNPVPSVRKVLWKKLFMLVEAMESSWLIGGDFNSIVYKSERKGWFNRRTRICKDFVKWIEDNNIHDLQFQGNKFTWSGGNLIERLDRAMCNHSWLMSHPKAQVMHLPKIQSIHRPILIKFWGKSTTNGAKSLFRFLAPWLLHPEFSEFVNSSWDHFKDFIEASSEFREKVTKWNIDVFGNIFKKKRVLLARLNGIQKAMERYSSKKLKKLDQELRKELDEIMLQEEVFWNQKSVREWINLGDRNTAYFHQKATQRIGINIISLLKNESGEWMSDEEQLRDYVTQFFKEVYTKGENDNPVYGIRNAFPIIVDDKMLELGKEISDKEIKAGMFSMKPLKALGFDGIPAIFYQSQWESVGKSVCNFAKEVFTSRKIPEEINKTQIVLFPKKNPESIRMFRPISLCTMVYKTISKVIMNRLKDMMADLIGSN